MTRALVVLAMLLMACSKPTELLVVMSTDVPSNMYDALSVQVGDHDSGKTSFSRTYLVPDETTLPASLDLHPTSGSPTVELDLALESQGAPLVTRTAIVSFVSDHSLLLRIELQAACEHVTCDPGSTCIDGTCQSDVIEPVTLTPIPSDPLAPVDMASMPADAAVGPVTDAATIDLASPSDQAVFCPPIPSAPNQGVCQIYTPNGAPAIASSFSVGPQKADIRMCPDDTRYVVSLSQQSGNGVEFQVRKMTPITTTPVIVRAGYWMSADGSGGEAGVFIDDNATTVQAYTQTTSDAAEDLYRNSTTKGASYLGSSDFKGAHALELDGSYSGIVSPTTFDFNAWSSGIGSTSATSYLLPSETMRTTDYVGFFAATGGNSGTVDIQLAWIQVCTAK